MGVQIDSTVISLFHFIDSGSYEGLVDLIYKSEKQQDLEECFKSYLHLLSIDVSEKTKYESKLQSFNAALYFRRKVIPSIIEFGDIQEYYLITKKNIEKYKYTWRTLVEKHLQEESYKKFILKHYEESGKNKIKSEFIQSCLDVIKEWASDESSLLSQFFYIDDLQANQKKVILSNEPVYVFLNELLNNPEAAYLNDILFTVREKDKILSSKKKGGKLPNLILQDGIFRVEPYKLFASKSKERENDYVTDYSSQLKIYTPKYVENQDIDTKFDSSKDVIHHGQFELATLTAIFQIGQDDLLKGSRISFTIDEVCEKLGVTRATWAYQRIALAIFYLSINLFSVKISDEKERIFHIISAIEKPIFNSDRQKEWTIEIDPLLREYVVKNYVTELYADQIAGFTYETTAILFKTFLLDAQRHDINEPKEYTLAELSQRTVLSGKPNRRRKKIINALNELVAHQKIEKFTILDDGDRFLVYFKKGTAENLLA